MERDAVHRAIDTLGGAEMGLQILDFEQCHLTGFWPCGDRARHASRRRAG
jgi:hypothetical protein